MIKLCWLIPFFPLLGGLVAAVGGRWLKQWSHVPVVAGIALAFLVALPLWFAAGPSVTHPAEVETATRTVLVYDWFQAGDLHVPILLRVDGLSTMMAAMVTFVACLIAIFAAGYMAGDPGYARFFAVMGLFVASMTGLVLSSHFVLTYACWEGVGVCSYLLIGFWHTKPAAAAAAKKAFLVNRLGDLGFAIALFWLWSMVPGHDLGYDNVLAKATLIKLPEATKIGIALLLFWAATAKSAQIPLYVWLPDAMEGPTPVSALIHAATMVTAGVYLIARSAPLVMSNPAVPMVICVIGCATALLSAAIALTQTDLKRVLAYSTVSQLGFMFMGLGAGVGGVMRLAVIAGLFHLFTHAFFKALLFLGAGSVMHSMGGVIDIRRFGGLRHRMPITHGTFAAGALALAGIWPLAGFWSKDEILSAVRLASHEVTTASGIPGLAWVYIAIYWLAVITAFLTAFYTGRAYFLTFWGPEKLPSPDDPEAEAGESLGHGAHGDEMDQAIEPVEESRTPAPPGGAITPEMAAQFAMMAMGGGLHAHEDESDPDLVADLPDGATSEPVPANGGHNGHDSHFGHESPNIMTTPLLVLAFCAVLVGLVFGPSEVFRSHLERTPGFELLQNVERHSTDWLSIGLGTLAGVGGIGLAFLMYNWLPGTIPAQLATRLQPLYRASYRKFGVDELYTRTVIAFTWISARVSAVIDTYVIDGLVRLTAWLPRFVGRDLLAPFQNGFVQFYAGVTALGVALLMLFLLFS